jgi:ferrous iron transport protein A
MNPSSRKHLSHSYNVSALLTVRRMDRKLRERSKSKCVTLAELEVGHRARILQLKVEGLTRRRLLDLGLLPGTETRALMRSPLGDPIAYEIRGSTLALRSGDASKIVVELLS